MKFVMCILQSLVPLGSVEELLATYDSQRRELPAPVTVWEWGWTKSAETWNGRAAMLAVLVLLFLEVTTGQGFLHQWGLLPLFHWQSLPISLPSTLMILFWLWRLEVWCEFRIPCPSISYFLWREKRGKEKKIMSKKKKKQQGHYRPSLNSCILMGLDDFWVL